MVSGSTVRLWNFVFAAFLSIYLALLASQWGHGVASFDGQAVIRVTQKLVDHHQLEVSRPPGHPTTEIYLFPAIAWILRYMFGADFNEPAYLVCQAAAAVIALVIFFRLLLRCGVQQWKAVVACVCLGLSSQFFANAVDGEEFVWAVLFLILCCYLLVMSPTGSWPYKHLFLAAFSFALATGCRPEVILAGFLLPVWALCHPKGNWRMATIALAAEGAAIALVWLPILYVGVHAPYTAGMNVRESILGGCYRLMFQCFTPAVFVLFCWILLRSAMEWRTRNDNYPNNFVYLAGCIMPLVFFAALFLHASKPAHVLVAVPFILLLAVRRSDVLLIGLTVATVIGCVISLDIFKERRLIRPYLVSGSYFQAVRQKPYYKFAYLQRALEQCGPANAAVIADLWPWDIQYQIRNGRFRATEQSFTDADGVVPGFSVASAARRWSASPARTIGQRPMPQCILLPRDAALRPTIVSQIKTEGYALKIDRLLYRTLFARYDVTGPAAVEGQIGTVPVEFFTIPAAPR